jgi:hypothetical protein
MDTAKFSSPNFKVAVKSPKNILFILKRPTNMFFITSESPGPENVSKKQVFRHPILTCVAPNLLTQSILEVFDLTVKKASFLLLNSTIIRDLNLC